MAIDIALLRIVKYREQYNKVARYIPKASMDKKTIAIVRDIGRYFKDSNEDVIDFAAFRSLFFNSWHKGLSEGDLVYYNKTITNMEQDVPEGQKKTIINTLLELEFATAVANVVNDFDQEGDISVVAEIDNLVTGIKKSVERTQKFDFATEDEMGDEVDPDSGLKWPLDILNERYRNAMGGDQIIVAARPGLGKTSFLTHTCYSFAQDMKDNQVILWFNNEGPRARILSRQYMSALNATAAELKTYKDDGTLRDKYIKAIGRVDRVRVYNVHGFSNHQLEEMIESVGVGNIGAVVWDMLDNVKFPTRKDLREDQRLEQMYQWARELAVKYGFVSLPTSQVSLDGSGMLYPLQHMLKDSKTGKQGACDNILMIGSEEDVLKPYERGISMPKEKSLRVGATDVHEPVIFDKARGRYK